MSQFARPISDHTIPASYNGSYADIDESSASDSDFGYFDNNSGGNEVIFNLTSLTDPSSSSGHILRVRIARMNAGELDGGGTSVTANVSILIGGSEVAALVDLISEVATGSWTTHEYTLSGAEADAISDYTDMEIRIDQSGGGGSPSNRRGLGISWAEFEVPESGGGGGGSRRVLVI